MRARLGFLLLCGAVFFVVLPSRAATQRLEVDPIPSFGETCIEGSSAKSVTVRNPNQDPVTLNAINVVGESAADFTLTGFVPGEIPGDSTRTYQLTFSPKPTGPRTREAALQFEASQSNDEPNPNPQPVSGNAVSRVLEVAPASLTFAEQRIGTRSPPKQISIRNTGSDVLRFAGAKLSGGQTSDFRLLGLPGAADIPRGGTLNGTMTFQPRIAGKRSTTVAISSNSCTGPTKTVAVSGTGIAPVIRIDPQVLDLGQVPVGTPSTRVPLVVSNEGKAPLKVSQIQIVGADAADFAFEALPPLPRTVAAGDSFLLNVIFTPSGDGTRRAGARVTSDDPGRPIFEITLTGVGGAASLPPTTSPTATPIATETATSSEPPRASGAGGGPGDWIAIALVVLLVLGAFIGLIVLKRVRGEQG